MLPSVHAAAQAPPPTPALQPAVGGQPFTLDEAVAFALKNNPRVGGAAAQVRQARARITQQRALRGPQLGVNNNVFRQGPVIPGFSPGSPPAFPPHRYNVGVFISQVVFDWGQRASRQSAAEREAAAAEFRTAETQNDVRLVVAATFLNILRAQQLLIVANERSESTAEQLRVAKARFEADVAPRYDVIRSEAEHANAQQSVIEAQNDVALAHAAFNTALGRPVETPVLLRYEPEPPRPEVPFDAARDTGLENRPQLDALREDIKSGQHEVKARRAENRPQIAIAGAYDRPNPGGFAPTAYRYNLGLVMTWPFFDSGFTRGRVREAQGLLEEDRKAFDQARQQMELDVRQALLDIDEAQKRITVARTELTASREALRVSEVRYRAGVGTNVEVTDAQVATARAGQNVANAQFDYETAIARLEYATGTTLDKLLAPPPPASPVK